MRFDELYEKYLNNECTDEEKAFVEGELAKAMIVNEAVNGRKVELKPAEDAKIKKVKKKFGWKMLLTAFIVTVAVLLVATGAVLGGVFGTAVGSAKKSDALGMDKASEQAADFVYAYLTGNGYYSGTKEAMVVKDKEREFKMTTPLKNSVYVYEFEIIAHCVNGGVYEVEVELNSATGKCEITHIDYEGEKPKPNVDMDWRWAQEKATNCASDYLKEKGYTGAWTYYTIVDSEYEIKAYSGWGYYIYEFEIVVQTAAGKYELDVVVDTHTDSCYVKEFEIK